ncbi:MAG TPA: hypothetical protein VNS63_08745 [Blastocatellia bacterium]|nr:hypothetical protein [Blastocatellia bacterium]
MTRRSDALFVQLELGLAVVSENTTAGTVLSNPHSAAGAREDFPEATSPINRACPEFTIGQRLSAGDAPRRTTTARFSVLRSGRL